MVLYIRSTVMVIPHGVECEREHSASGRVVRCHEIHALTYCIPLQFSVNLLFDDLKNIDLFTYARWKGYQIVATRTISPLLTSGLKSNSIVNYLFYKGCV